MEGASRAIFQNYRVSKKTLLKGMCDFLTIKMLPLALMLIKTKKLQSFLPIGQRMLILNGNLEF